MNASDESASVADLDALRHEHPGWRFGSVWASAASGPDARRLYAAKDGRLITAWTAAELAADIRREERDGHS
jgi:hypothetical protein